MTREQQARTTQKKFEDIVKQSDLVNQTVYDSDTMDELGRVEVLWMFPQVNRVLGFVCRSGLLGRQKTAFKLSQLVAVGQNSILVDGDGEPTVADKVQKLESLVHREVWSDAGEPVGYITDCLFNYRSGVIVRYLMAKRRFNTFTDDIYFLPPKAIKSFGSQRVLVDQNVVPTLKPYRHGLKSKLALARETVQTEYIDEWKAELQTLVQQVQTFSQGALQKVERLSDRLRQETRTFVEQAKSSVEQAKSSGQTWAEQLRTESQNLGQTFSESFQEFTTRTETERSHASDEELDDQVISESAVSRDVDLAWDDQWEEDLDDLDELDDWDDDSSSSNTKADSSQNSSVQDRSPFPSDRPQPQSETRSDDRPNSSISTPTPDSSAASVTDTTDTTPVDVQASSGSWQVGDDPWDDLWEDEPASHEAEASPPPNHFSTVPKSTVPEPDASASDSEIEPETVSSEDASHPNSTPPASEGNRSIDDDPWV